MREMSAPSEVELLKDGERVAYMSLDDRSGSRLSNWGNPLAPCPGCPR